MTALSARHLRTLVMLAAVLGAAPALADFAVSPVLIQKAVTSQDATVEFTVSNPGDEPLQITLATAPLSHDRNGAPVEGGPGYAFDASHLIHLPQPSFVLQPRRWKRVRARVELPSRTGGGYAFIYARAQPVSSGTVAQVETALRVGVVVQLAFPGDSRLAVEVQEPRLERGALRIPVRNTGELHVRPTGTVRLIDAEGRAVWSGAVVSANIFPGLVRELAVEGVPRELPPGDYRLQVELSGPGTARSERAATFVDGQLALPPPAAERPR